MPRELYPSLPKLPKVVVKKPKASTPTGFVRVEDYNGRKLEQAFKQAK